MSGGRTTHYSNPSTICLPQTDLAALRYPSMHSRSLGAVRGYRGQSRQVRRELAELNASLQAVNALEARYGLIRRSNDPEIQDVWRDWQEETATVTRMLQEGTLSDREALREIRRLEAQVSKKLIDNYYVALSSATEQEARAQRMAALRRMGQRTEMSYVSGYSNYEPEVRRAAGELNASIQAVNELEDQHRLVRNSPNSPAEQEWAEIQEQVRTLTYELQEGTLSEQEALTRIRTLDRRISEQFIPRTYATHTSTTPEERETHAQETEARRRFALRRMGLSDGPDRVDLTEDVAALPLDQQIERYQLLLAEAVDSLHQIQDPQMRQRWADHLEQTVSNLEKYQELAREGRLTEHNKDQLRGIIASAFSEDRGSLRYRVTEARLNPLVDVVQVGDKHYIEVSERLLQGGWLIYGEDQSAGTHELRGRTAYGQLREAEVYGDREKRFGLYSGLYRRGPRKPLVALTREGARVLLPSGTRLTRDDIDLSALAESLR